LVKKQPIYLEHFCRLIANNTTFDGLQNFIVHIMATFAGICSSSGHNS